MFNNELYLYKRTENLILVATYLLKPIHGFHVTNSEFRQVILRQSHNQARYTNHNSLEAFSQLK